MPQEILKNIYRIEIPLPNNPLKRLNSYLIKGKGRSLLIDTGFHQSECRTAMMEALETLAVRREEIDVFGTHIHSDHIGLAPEIVGADRKIYIGEGDAHWLSSAESNIFWNSMDLRFVEEGFPQEGLDELVTTNPARNLGPPLDLPNYRAVKDGQILRVGAYELEVVAAPGHTPGQVCLWLAREQVMFTADHILFDITPNIAVWPNMEDALGSYLESLRKFRLYDVKLALPGHRETGDYYGRIDALLKHHDHRVAETLSIVQEKPGMLAYEIAGLMTWAIRAKNWGEFPLIQKWFAVCECISHLDYLRKRGQVERRKEGGLHHYYPTIDLRKEGIRSKILKPQE